MDEEDKQQLCALLKQATSPGEVDSLREVLKSLPGQACQILSREAKDPLGLAMAGSPVVGFSPPVNRKIDAIRIVRSMAGVGFREAKDYVEVGKVPIGVYVDAQRLVRELRDLGIVAEVTVV